MQTETVHFTIGAGISNLARDAFWYEQKFEWAEKVLLCFEGISPENIDDIFRGDAYLKPSNNGQTVQLILKEDSKFKFALIKHVEFIKRQVEEVHQEVYKLQTYKEQREFGLFSDPHSPVTEAALIIIDSNIKKLEEKSRRYIEFLEHYGRLFGQVVEADLYTKIGGYDIPKLMLDEYSDEVVKAIRRSIKMGTFTFMNPITLLELEERRRDLHDRIIDAAGLGKENRTGEKYSKFSDALERYLESKGAGLFDGKD
jgi:hypothetical protein